ncbi:SPOR domain-containing protein [Halomonas nitroreducens]|uniref:SPOR domain-containing protein n=1 Tax=Halomonas nitroreducens TaxID=447425 RepID=A0A431V544_9GAMM|nr:SPOR domain-containing protein [Halomonas nitroreducens]RTR05390.1 SPOR domain-containing protein [Halomonas nitroreducens]
MKYGMRERVSGALILIALAVIFVPLLFDDPAPREGRPEPVLTIEQPVEVERRDLADPQPPASLQESPATEEASASREPPPAQEEPPPTSSAPEPEPVPEPDAAPVAEADAPEEAAEEESSPDPIAELARAADERLARSEEAGEEAAASAPSSPAPGGEWAVQVGSFGEPGNAERLETRLTEQGFPAYRRPRGNDLTSVYVGPYGSSEVAEDVMGQLKARLNLQGLLVKAP